MSQEIDKPRTPSAPASLQRSRELATSLDGKWLVVRDGRQVRWPGGEITVADNAVLAFAGPPATLAVASATELALYQPPSIEPIARLDPAKVVAVTGPRFVVEAGGKLGLVRIAARAVSTHVMPAGDPIDFAVGLDRNLVLIGQPRGLTVWDASIPRPVAKVSLALPPPPFTTGAAAGHVWALARELFVYRRSDGRPFQYTVGPVTAICSHIASPVIVTASDRVLHRVHCHAHSVTAIDTPYAPGQPLAQLVEGETVTLLGLPDGASEPWRVDLSKPTAS